MDNIFRVSLRCNNEVATMVMWQIGSLSTSLARMAIMFPSGMSTFLRFTRIGLIFSPPFIFVVLFGRWLASALGWYTLLRRRPICCRWLYHHW